MKILFLDDCYLGNKKILGYAGYCIDGAAARPIAKALAALKKQYRIPDYVELKWAPGSKHFLTTRFTGSRHNLYADALKLIKQHDGRVLGAIHALADCYGVQEHGWTIPRAKLWAAEQQLRFLAERLHRPLLATADDVGFLVIDAYEDRRGGKELVDHCSFDMLLGTGFQDLSRIALVPMLTDSQQCVQVQLADIVVGITVGAITGSRHALALFDDLCPLFLWDPHERATAFASTVSSGIIGVGLKLFPAGSLETAAQAAFANADAGFIITKRGYVPKPKRG